MVADEPEHRRLPQPAGLAHRQQRQRVEASTRVGSICRRPDRGGDADGIAVQGIGRHVQLRVRQCPRQDRFGRQPGVVRRAVLAAAEVDA